MLLFFALGSDFIQYHGLGVGFEQLVWGLSWWQCFIVLCLEQVPCPSALCKFPLPENGIYNKWPSPRDYGGGKNQTWCCYKFTDQTCAQHLVLTVEKQKHSQTSSGAKTSTQRYPRPEKDVEVGQSIQPLFLPGLLTSFSTNISPKCFLLAGLAIVSALDQALHKCSMEVLTTVWSSYHCPLGRF